MIALLCLVTLADTVGSTGMLTWIGNPKQNLNIWYQPPFNLEVALASQSLWACWNAWTAAQWPQGQPRAYQPSWGSPQTWPQWPWTAYCWPWPPLSFPGWEACLADLTGIQPRSHQNLEVAIGLASEQPGQFEFIHDMPRLCFSNVPTPSWTSPYA